MKRFLVLLLVVEALIASPAAASAKPAKVEVCHFNDQGEWQVNRVSERGAAAHLRHGDGVPNGPVPGTVADTFDDECVAVAGGVGPLNAEVEVEPGRMASVVVGHSGGVLETSGSDGTSYRLTIPEGALIGEFSVSMTPMTGVDGTPFDDSFVRGVVLEPSGLVFLKAAVLEVVLADEPFALDAFGFGFSGDGEDFHSQMAVFSGTTASVEIWHFSGWGAATGGEALNALQVYTPTDPDKALFRRVTNALDQAAFACLSGGDCGQPNVADPLVEASVAVIAALTEAKINPHAPTFSFANPIFPSVVPQASLALSNASNWLALVNLVGLSDDPAMAELVGEVTTLVVDVWGAARDKAHEGCTGRQIETAPLEQSLRLQMRYVIQWEVEAAPWLDITASPSEALDRCAAVFIADSDVPGYLDGGTAEEARFQVGVRFKGTAGTTRYDLVSIGVVSDGGAPALDIEADGATVSSGSEPDGDGWIEVTINKETDEDAILRVAALWECCGMNTQGYGPFRSVESEFTIRPKNALTLMAKPLPGGTPTASPVIDPNQAAEIQATVLLDNAPAIDKEVEFSKEGGGSLNVSTAQTGSDGVAKVTFTAPSEPGQTTITATATTASGSKTKTITIVYGSRLDVTPSAASVNTGGTADFSATTTNLDPATVNWTATCGTLSTTTELNTTWTAPGTAGQCTVRATSAADTGIFGEAVVTVEEDQLNVDQIVGRYFGRRDQTACPGYERGRTMWFDIHQTDGNLFLWMWTYVSDSDGTIDEWRGAKYPLTVSGATVIANTTYQNWWVIPTTLPDYLDSHPLSNTIELGEDSIRITFSATSATVIWFEEGCDFYEADVTRGTLDPFSNTLADHVAGNWIWP